VEIGAAAQHGFLGKLLHHLARPVIHHLINDRGGVAIVTTWFDTDALDIETWTAAESTRTVASDAATLWLAGNSVATALCAASLIG